MFRHPLATVLRRPPLRRRLIIRFASPFCSLQSPQNETETVIVKPSSPTPGHLAKFKLSLVDLYFPPMYTPFIFFYPPAPATAGGESRLDILKSSLAHALTHFYPLAGRFMSKGVHIIPFIHCNDEGVPFSSAAAGCRLDTFLARPPEIESLHQFLPFRKPFLIGADFKPEMAIRATVFPCGGIALGVTFSHKFMDAHSLVDFMKLWAAIAAGGDEQVGDTVAYAHDRAATSLFPAHHGDVYPPADHYLSKGGERSVTRRFVFDEEAISALKLRVRSEPVPNPTRTEAVFGLVWRSAVNATVRSLLVETGGSRPSVLSIGAMPVDLRPRMKEPWPDYSVGNVMLDLICSYDTNQQSDSWDETKTLQQFVQKLRSSFAKVDKEFMEKLEGGAGREEFLKYEEITSKMATDAIEIGSKVMPFTMTSAIGMRFYDVDFGWGRPMWVSMCEFPDQFSNIMVLMSTPTGYGVEAWIALSEEKMTILEHDPVILTYAKKNPSVFG